MSTLTTANITIMATVDGLFPIPVKLEGFAADDIFSAEPIAQTEVLMGVDGKMSAGFVYAVQPMNIMFQADSPSIPIMDAWRLQQLAKRDVFFGDFVVNMPATGMTYLLKHGVLTNAPPMPAAKKILQPMTYSLTFESIVGAPI